MNRCLLKPPICLFNQILKLSFTSFPNQQMRQQQQQMMMQRPRGAVPQNQPMMGQPMAGGAQQPMGGGAQGGMGGGPQGMGAGPQGMGAGPQGMGGAQMGGQMGQQGQGQQGNLIPDDFDINSFM